LTAISTLGCTNETQYTITYEISPLIYVPNTFTPDGDNYNQVFTPVFTTGYDPYNFEMLIFNRWGELIFESHDASIGWDGSYGTNGNDVQDGVYTWKITYKNPQNDKRQILVGHVTLIK
jgi:gliding motility-associated-like protein